MRFEVQQAELIKALTALSRMIVKVAKDSYLQNVKITKLDSSHIRLVASDLTSSMQYDIEAVNIDGNGILYNLNNLTSIISRLEGVISFDKNIIKTKKSKFKISNASIELYPEINFDRGAEKYTIDALEFNNAVSKTLYATSKINNSVLAGIYFSEGDVVSTDSNRLTIAKINSQLPQFVLPRTIGEEILRLFADGSIDFQFENNKIYISNDKIVFIGHTLAGKFPQYKLLLPQSFEHTVRFKNTDLAKAINLITPILDSKAMICLLGINGEQINISGYNLSSEGETEFELDASNVMEEKFLGFNAQYLLDMLKNFDTDITMKFNSTNRAVVFEDNNNGYALIMPITGVKKCNK